MFSNFKFRKVLWGLLGVLLVGTIGFALSQQASRHCKNIRIEIDKGSAEDFLITTEDVDKLITDNGQDQLINRPFSEIDFQHLESRVKSNKVVDNCQIYRDLRGDLVVAITQHRPIARVTFEGGVSSVHDLYVNEKGEFFPMSDRHTARVLLLSGHYFERLMGLTRTQDKSLVELLNWIDQDPFWKAQITQLEIDKEGEINMMPQVGEHTVEFGDASDPEAKFSKLKLFYTKILPAKGWNHYHRVSVKFRNQIVCE
ncbi:MAG: hypothetical protein U0Y10_05575 [Spirosomataceae bacterium]